MENRVRTPQTTKSNQSLADELKLIMVRVGGCELEPARPALRALTPLPISVPARAAH